MKLSQGFWQTYKEDPNDAEITSHKLMIRAGLIQKSAGGLYTYLPMGLRSIQKVEKIIREEHDRAGFYELTLNVVTPGELWQESGRWDVMGPLMLKAVDRAGRDLCLSPTNEEAVVDVFRRTVKSYKQLPITLYQINTKFRDEIRPRYGLMRGREFTMKDAYSFHEDWKSLDEVYEKFYKVYSDIFSRMGLEFIAVEADGGAMAGGNAKTHEFQVLAASGEDKVIKCLSCGYAANVEKAETKRGNLNLLKTNDKPESVDTPSKATIEDVCNFLKVPQEQSLKSLVYSSIVGEKETFCLLLMLGDDNLNELKLAALLGGDHIKAGNDRDLLDLNLEKGFIGPLNLKTKIKVYIDKAVDLDAAYITGANEKDKHLKNFVPSRDLKDFDIVDLREAKTGDHCEKCSKAVSEIRGIEVGHIFQLGDKYTKSMNATVLDKNGKHFFPPMGCYGIGVTRTVAAAIEQNNDENGIVWPVSIAPYHVYLGVISKNDEFKKIGEDIYNELWNNGVEAILDDRGVGPGFMFKDADLLGLPVRVVLGERDYKQDGLLEIKVRKTGESFKVKKEEVLSKVKELLSKL